ncbi:MAG: hypothetical protein IKV53_07980 [Clostridia bacterium]|nr:hypothetical protein [Clostridia bacterium]
MKAIGIDLGTTGICGVLIDVETGAVLSSRTDESHAFIKSDKPFESIQSPERIVTLATDILEGLIDDDTVAIGVTGQMHGIVYTNDEGLAVSPLYIWQDGRGNQPYLETTYAEHLKSHSGYGNVTDFYNRKNGLVSEDAVGYCTIHDYFVMRLCSLNRAKMHISDAASLGCFDIEKNVFNYPCDVDIVSDYEVAGYYKGIPVSVAIGDNQASVFSSLADKNGILLNVGTGSQVSVISDRIVNADGIETRPYFEGRYLLVGAALCGGRAYALLRDFYSKIFGYVTRADDSDVYGIMDKMLEGIDSSTLTVDTRFSGSRVDESVRGSIGNISTQNFTPEELTCGVLEGMTEELYGMYLLMNEKRCGIVGSGNGIRKNRALQRIMEKRFGGELSIPVHHEEAAYGAALFSLISAGYFKSAEEVQRLIRFE